MPLLRQGAAEDRPGAAGAELGAAGAELGANDELLAFQDEGEQEEQEEQEEKRSAAERRDLDDVKSSLVNESETRDSRSGPGRARFPVPGLVGFPFFMVPDLSSICGPYVTNGHTFLPFQWPLLDLPGTSALRETPATHLSSSMSLLSCAPEVVSPQRASPGPSPDAGVSRMLPSPGGVAQIAHPLSWLLMSGSFAPRSVMPPRPPVPVAAAGIKREPGCSDGKRPATDDEKTPHIKKPLNAFMLFMREERASVVNQCHVKESATINQILGQRWHSLSKEQQAQYYELARKERLAHSKLYPGWSARDNYGRKKKRKRMRTHTDTAASAQDFPLQLKRPRPTADGAAGGASPAWATSASRVTQASPASSLDSPATPTTALAAPAAPAPSHTELTCSPSGRASPCGEQPLLLMTKPPRTLLPLRLPASSASRTPPSFLVPPPTSTHQSAVSCRGALTQPLSVRRANQQ